MVKDKIKDLVIQAFRDLLMREIKKALVKIPLLASGPLNKVALFFLEKLVSWIIEVTSLQLYIWKLHLETSQEVHKVNEIAERYEDQKDRLTQQELEELDLELENAIYDLIEFNSNKLRRKPA